MKEKLCTFGHRRFHRIRQCFK